MRRFICTTLFSLYVLSICIISSVSAQQEPVNARSVNGYGKLPLAFVENRGQLSDQVKYVIRGPRASAFFRNDGVTFDLWDASPSSPESSLDAKNQLVPTRFGMNRMEKPRTSKPEMRTHSVLKLSFDGISQECTVEGTDELSGKANYLKGSDSSKWITDIRTFKGVVYKDVWPGVDLAYHGDRQQLKYDICVSPGADLKSIRLKYEGAEKIWLDKGGELHIKTAVTEFVERVPGIYQEKDGEKVLIKGGYVLLDSQTVGFQVDGYDPKLPLVVDPASDLVYSTFLGGSNTDWSSAIAVDSSGCAYVAGYTNSSGFPVTTGAFQTSYRGGEYDVFVTKLNASGSALAYSTLLGGSSGDRAFGITVDSSGCAYVTGFTGSSDFPTTPGAFNRTYWRGQAFVTKLDASGSTLVYSTFLGGIDDDYGSEVAVDSSGCAYVTGYTYSLNFPTTTGAFQRTYSGEFDAFVTKLNTSGSALVYSTFLGGSGDDAGGGIAVDSSGCAYVAGMTSSNNFPATAGALDMTHGAGGYDIFVTKLNASGSAPVYSTYLGGSYSDYGSRIAVDSSGCAYVTGDTSSPDFPITAGAFQTSIGDDQTFVAKLNAAGSALVYSTFLGGDNEDDAVGITVDSSGCAYVMGLTWSSNFPFTPGAYQAPIIGTGYGRIYVARLNASGDDLVYSACLGPATQDCGGGIAVDSAHCAYVTGRTSSLDFPITPGAFQTGLNGDRDVFAAKLLMEPGTPPAGDSLSAPAGVVSPAAKFTLIGRYSDGDGPTDLANCYALLNTTTGVSANSVYLRYNPVQDKLYLRNDAGTAWLGGYAPGSANVLENSQCRIYCAETTTSTFGNQLTVNWQAEIKPSMLDKTLLTWMYVSDRESRIDGWDRMGTLKVGNPPVDVSLFPAGGTWTHALRKQISCQYSDPDGYGDITYAYLLVNRTYGSGANSVYGVYNQKVNLLYLRNDANTGWIGGFAPGSANTMENAECKIYCADTTVTKSGNSLTVNWSILPKSGMIGTGWMGWLSVADRLGLSDGWDHYGTVSVQ